MPDQKKVPLGKPLRLSDQQLDQMSQVTPLDIEKAAGFWRAHVSPRFRSLLDAPRAEDQKVKQNGSAEQRPNK